MAIVKRKQNRHNGNLLRSPLDDLMERFFTGHPFAEQTNLTGSWMATDLAEEEDKFVVTMEMPGLSNEDIDISVTDNILSVSGEKKEAEEKSEGRNYYHVERRYGTFHREVQLPAPVEADAVEANYKNGVLEIALPKSEKARAKRIAVK